MNCAILTPLALEFEAIEHNFLNWKKVEGFPYYSIRTSFQGKYDNFNIFLVQSGSKTNPTTLATEKVIQFFQPSLIILTGIAGGVKDALIGDLVIATKAYGYESGKETSTGFESRPYVIPFSQSLIQHCQAVTRLIENKSYSVFFGPIASGDKVVAATNSSVYKKIKQYYNDTLALEMEAIGFAEAISNYRNIHGINIRCISDLLDHKSESDAIGLQKKAANNSADFVLEFLNHLNPKQLNISIMDSKKLAKEVVKLIFPLLNFSSVKEIGSQIKEATNTSILEIWDKVSPIFIEEFEAEKDAGEDTEDQEVQKTLKSSIETQLKRYFSKDTELSKTIDTILQEYNKSSEKKSNSISNSKNIIQGSSINVQGDFRLGDNNSKDRF